MVAVDAIENAYFRVTKLLLPKGKLDARSYLNKS